METICHSKHSNQIVSLLFTTVVRHGYEFQTIKQQLRLKGQRNGFGRSEFEYAIPTSDAEEMLRTMCDDRVLEKMRYGADLGD